MKILTFAAMRQAIPEAEVVTVLTREDGAAFVFLKNGKVTWF